MKIDEQWECWTLCAIKMRARNGGKKGRHLWPRLVQKIAEGKTSQELSWKLKVMAKYIYIRYFSSWISRTRRNVVCFCVWTFGKQSMNKYSNIIPGSTVRTLLRLFAKMPAASYCLCRCHVERWLTTLHRWILGKHLRYFMLYICMFFTFVSPKRINCYRLSYCADISNRVSCKTDANGNKMLQSFVSNLLKNKSAEDTLVRPL